MLSLYLLDPQSTPLDNTLNISIPVATPLLDVPIELVILPPPEQRHPTRAVLEKKYLAVSLAASRHLAESSFGIFKRADAERIDDGVVATIGNGEGARVHHGEGHIREAWPITLRMLRSHPRDLLCCLLYTSPSPRDGLLSRMPSSA